MQGIPEIPEAPTHKTETKSFIYNLDEKLYISSFSNQNSN
jgi:hypothetical protein